MLIQDRKTEDALPGLDRGTVSVEFTEEYVRNAYKKEVEHESVKKTTWLNSPTWTSLAYTWEMIRLS